jgi:hypothetical protein
VAATDPQSLLASANCYLCYANSGNMLALLRVALLRQILLASNPNAVTDPQTLLQQANCYLCYANSPNYLQLLEVALLAQISTNGSTGGGGSVQLVTYTSGTPANPTNINNPALAYDPNGIQPIMNWNPTTHVWV